MSNAWLQLAETVVNDLLEEKDVIGSLNYLCYQYQITSGGSSYSFDELSIKTLCFL